MPKNNAEIEPVEDIWLSIENTAAAQWALEYVMDELDIPYVFLGGRTYITFRISALDLTVFNLANTECLEDVVYYAMVDVMYDNREYFR